MTLGGSAEPRASRPHQVFGATSPKGAPLRPARPTGRRRIDPLRTWAGPELPVLTPPERARREAPRERGKLITAYEYHRPETMRRSEDPITRATHRTIGKDLFSYTWSLLDRPRRTREEDDEMLHAAHASRYHWGRAGSALNRSIGEWQVSRVYAVLKRSEPASYHGRRALALALRHRLAPFYVAYGYEALARAAAVGHDRAGRNANLRKATRLVPRVRDPDDRRMLEEDLGTIP